MTETVLESWNNGPAKQAVVDFVASATTPGPGFVSVADRVATFDNDGTLWVEQPLPPQFDFVFRKSVVRSPWRRGLRASKPDRDARGVVREWPS
jgi:hypothetical protein